MKKILISMLLMLFVVSGCSSTSPSSNSNSNSKVSDNSIKQSDIKGYWRQIEENSYGEVKDLSNDNYAYLEITDDRLYFYAYYEDTDTSSVSKKYYKLEKDQIYYDYNELKGNNWKENIGELTGGVFKVSIDNDKLVLYEYYTENSKEDEYVKNTYERVDIKDWPNALKDQNN